MAVRACWCRVCQYLGSGNATINAVFRADSIAVEGQTTDYESIADSGEIMHRRFCPDCGTPVFSQAQSRPHVTIVRVGTLDNRDGFPPSGLIWAASAPCWAPIDPGLPAIDGQPPAPPAP
jgi:hypothetical protein